MEWAAKLTTHFNTEGELETEHNGDTTGSTDLTTKTELEEAAMDELKEAARATEASTGTRLIAARPTTPQTRVTDGAFLVRSPKSSSSAVTVHAL